MEDELTDRCSPVSSLNIPYLLTRSPPQAENEQPSPRAELEASRFGQTPRPQLLCGGKFESRWSL